MIIGKKSMLMLMGGGNGKAIPKEIDENHGLKKPPEVDKRLPFVEFRDLYTLKNYWKTVQRNHKYCSNKLLFK